MSNKKETAGAVSWWMGMKLLPLEIEILSEFQVAGEVYDQQLIPQTSGYCADIHQVSLEE